MKKIGIIMLMMAIMAANVYAGDDMALHRDFVLHGVSNEQAYKRVNDFMHVYHHGIRGFTSTDISGEIYSDSKTSEVRATFNGGMIPERINTAQFGTDTHVTVATVRRIFKWDRQELDAAQRSIESGIPNCR